jgi:hypothetical protein
MQLPAPSEALTSEVFSSFWSVVGTFSEQILAFSVLFSCCGHCMNKQSLRNMYAVYQQITRRPREAGRQGAAQL